MSQTQQTLQEPIYSMNIGTFSYIHLGNLIYFKYGPICGWADDIRLSFPLPCSWENVLGRGQCVIRVPLYASEFLTERNPAWATWDHGKSQFGQGIVPRFCCFHGYVYVSDCLIRQSWDYAHGLWQYKVRSLTSYFRKNGWMENW